MAEAIGVELGGASRLRWTKKAIVTVVLIALVGSGLVAVYLAADIVDADPAVRKTANEPRLVSRNDSSVSEIVNDIRGRKRKSKFDESAYKATYYPIVSPFTSNLNGSNSFAQLSISVATYYDESVLENIAEHETAIRSAVLLSLAEQDLETLSTQHGKQILQQVLTREINKVLKEKTGFGGVNNVYFTSFVVQ